MATGCWCGECRWVTGKRWKGSGQNNGCRLYGLRPTCRRLIGDNLQFLPEFQAVGERCAKTWYRHQYYVI